MPAAASSRSSMAKGAAPPVFKRELMSSPRCPSSAEGLLGSSASAGSCSILGSEVTW